MFRQHVAARVSLLLGLALAAFALARLVLWAAHPDDFDALALGEVAFAFANGVRFDLSIALIALGGPLLALLLPLRWAARRAWVAAWSWVAFALLLGFVFLLVADLLYFGIVHRHVGPEVALVAGDPGLLFDIAVKDYGWALAVFALAAVGLALLWRRLFGGEAIVPRSHWAQAALFIVAIGAMAFGIRGTGFPGKPLGIVNAFAGGSAAVGHLTLNGPFTMAHSLLTSRQKAAAFLPWNEALAETRALVLGARDQLPDAERYPLTRATPAGAARKPNVVVLMLESWDAAHIDALRRAAGLAPLGLTPNFDALARAGVLFTHFYANGERSIEGLAAILAGMPTLPGTSYLGFGMEQSALSYLGRLARTEGYATYFLQGSQRTSFRIDAIAELAGFDRYLGAEDIPPSGHTALVTERGVWDDDTLQHAHRLFAASPRPFLGYVFTASTHAPYQSPGEQWRRRPGENREQQYMNSLYYADWALGRFFAAAQSAGYYDNTVFVLTADHVSGFGAGTDVPSRHHVPLLVIAPGRLHPARDARLGSHIDILPSVVGLAGWRTPHAGFGRSLFAPTTEGQVAGAFCTEGSLIARIEPQGWVTHDLTRRVAGQAARPPADLDGIERRLLAMHQVALTLLYQNRIYPPPGAQTRLARRALIPEAAARP